MGIFQPGPRSDKSDFQKFVVDEDTETDSRRQLENESRKQPPGLQKNLLDDSEYKLVWEVLGFDPKPMDIIIEQTGLKANAISSMLLMMELKGMVKKHSSGRYLRA